MRSKSRTKIVVAAAVLCGAMLGFVGDASAQQAAGSGSDSGSGTVIHMCVCRGSCKLVTMCLLNYCYSETVCDDCANCHAQQVSSSRAKRKACLYLKDNACVTNVTARRWF
ncbi:MAG: hypothetical protein WCE24_10335 [Pseudolabrys sp.]